MGSQSCMGTLPILVSRRLGRALFRRRFIDKKTHRSAGRVIASCNGLVVLSKSLIYYTDMSVWNPSTGFVRQIPSPEIWSEKRTSRRSVSLGFGHVMATDDYKLVYFVSIYFDVHIYIQSGVAHGKLSVLLRFHSPATMTLLFWCQMEQFIGSVVGSLTAFDLADEKFRKLPLPRALIQHEDVMNELSIRTRVLAGGCLRVWSQNKHGHSEIWEMKEYGIPESWVKMFQFIVLDLPDVFSSAYGWSPVFVTEDGTVVILRDKELVRIECHREEKPVCSGRYKVEGAMVSFLQYFVTVYDETLLSV